jgi:hypothetical protein
VLHDIIGFCCISPDAILQTRVSDGTRVRGLPQVDAVNLVAWAPHAHILAFACEDAKAPRPEHHSIRVVAPAP